MGDSTQQTAADWFDASSSRRQPVTLRVQGTHLLAESAGGTHSVPLADVRLSARLGDVPRQLHLPDGAMISVADHAFVAAAFPVQRGGWMHKAERHWRWLLLLGVLALALGVATYRIGLPWAAQQLAERIPDEYVQQLSAEVYANLRAEGILAPSTLSPPQRARAERLFEEIAAPGVYLAVHRFSIGGGTSLANAFAFPDGMIVLTDALFPLLSDDELHAVLAHEAGHVRHRHGLRLMLQALGVSTFVFFITGDISGVSLSLVPVALANMHYSREFERAADCYAADHLRARGKSPALLASALQKMEAEADKIFEEEETAESAPNEEEVSADSELAQPEQEEDGQDAPPEAKEAGVVWQQLARILSTHPATEERANLEQLCN